MNRFRWDGLAVLFDGEPELLPEVFGLEAGGLIGVVRNGGRLGPAFLFGIGSGQDEVDPDDDSVAALVIRG